MKKILVTGGAGFIGSSLINKLLDLGFFVINIDNFDPFYSKEIKEANLQEFKNNKNYRFSEINIENFDELKEVFEENKFDQIIHLAAKAGVRPSIEKPLEYVKTNILGTTNILELAKEYEIPKMIFASSSSVYGNCDAEKFSEDLKVSNPISPYAATKLAGEQLCYTYSKLHNLQILCLRFFTVYGPKQRPDLAIHKFINLIENNEKIPFFGDGETLRDYTYIDDILDGIISAMKYENTQYEIINLGSANPIPLKTMVSTIETVLDKKAQLERLPDQQGDVKKTFADITKAKTLLNFEPKVNFKNGIENFLAWKNNP